MPRGDGTGPNGQGPMTGRGAGYCAGFNTQGYANPMPRRGMGFGRGRGFGNGFGFRRSFASAQPVYQQPELTKEQETQILEQEAKAVEEEQKSLKQEMDAIKKRIEDLKSKKSE